MLRKESTGLTIPFDSTTEIGLVTQGKLYPHGTKSNITAAFTKHFHSFTW